MVVGQDIAFGADDHTAAQSHLRAIVFAVSVKKPEPWVIGQRMRSTRLGGGDADHRRRRAFCGRAHAAGHHSARSVSWGLEQGHALQRCAAV